MSGCGSVASALESVFGRSSAPLNGSPGGGGSAGSGFISLRPRAGLEQIETADDLYRSGFMESWAICRGAAPVPGQPRSATPCKARSMGVGHFTKLHSHIYSEVM